MDQNLARLKHGAKTEIVIGTFYDVYNELGYGFLESVYREAMVVALNNSGVQVEREKSVDVYFRNTRVGAFRMDLVVADCVVIELKSARGIEPAHEAQLLNYLKATGYEVGLLLNFGPRPQFRRMIFGNSRKASRPVTADSPGYQSSSRDYAAHGKVE
jgi:GxxExxY protein